MTTNLADEFAAAWNAPNAAPDVVAFLSRHPRATVEQVVSVLLIDQAYRWQTNNPMSVEQYLEHFPDLAENDELVYRLVSGESRARRTGEGDGSTAESSARLLQHTESFRGGANRGSDSNEKQGKSLEWNESTATYSEIDSSKHVGRYRIDRLLGRGGFGRVWLAYDTDLHRQVAVKVSDLRRFATATDAEAYFAEARALAALDHPNIVPVHDVGRTVDGSVYIVSKFIEGADLHTRIKERRPSFEEGARIIAQIARALHHAHEHRFIHRDVKPSNILIEDSSHHPYLTDFGLAVREEDYLRKGDVAGTPSYMSPEQARGEGHRLSASSDVFSLGVVLYEVLLGANPFRHSSHEQARRNVIFNEPTPPREVNKRIPKELERICVKAMAKRGSDRYGSALQFAEELEHWFAYPDDQSYRKARVIPKGLRSFDEADSEFFLDLIPGPRDRGGLPESVCFWIDHFEQTDADKTFPVGLLCGPSGCGKSSLFRAGVLTRLSGPVVSVYVEATSDRTEVRILNGLKKQVPDLPADLDLVQALARIRRRAQTKVVVVLDQFEQWLHARRNDPDTELADALRQCDGGTVQAVLLVRDEFAMAAARFFASLEVPIIQGRNFASVDLFELDHAKKVLTRFGQAFDKLPNLSSEIPERQQRFLDSVVSGIAQDNKVVPVRLSLFAEMIKGKAWEPSTLDQAGGAEGVGVRFLEEKFSAPGANPKHRLHQKAARHVLRSLLPEAGLYLKGHMRSYQELLVASGYSGRETAFNELLSILDGELRLITPTDPEGTTSVAGDAEREGVDESAYYQLTHDYLVPSLYQWLTRKQRETRRGRAHLQLEEREGLWSAKPERRHLPSLWECLTIWTLTDKKNWTASQKRMMRAAAWTRGTQWMVSLLAVVVLASAFRSYSARRREAGQRTQAALIVDSLLTAPADAVPYVLEKLSPLDEYATPILQRRLENAAGTPEELHALVALAELGQVELDALLDCVVWAPRGECPNIILGLGKQREPALQAIRQRVQQAAAGKRWREKARLAIVSLHLGDVAPARDMLTLRPDPLQRTLLIDTLPAWHGGVDELLEASAQVNDVALRSGICLGIGSLAADDLPTQQRRRCERVLADWYASHQDASVHSATGWALRRWNVRLPKTPSALPEPGDERAWYVNTLGMTMLRIEPGSFVRHKVNPQDPARYIERSQNVTLTQPYWLCDRETSRALFRKFIDDAEYFVDQKPTGWEGARLSRSPTPAHPVQQVSWVDAVLFCNWLSHSEQLEPSYQWIESHWEAKPEANGYRLPSEAEWEFACRAGTTTDFSSGDDEGLLLGYAVCLSNSTQVCGSRLPNGWGLFDMHGNVYEWCQDWYGSFGSEDALDPSGPDWGTDRVLRGGAFDYEPVRAASTYRAKNRSGYRSYTVGFRVARNYVVQPD